MNQSAQIYSTMWLYRWPATGLSKNVQCNKSFQRRSPRIHGTPSMKIFTMQGPLDMCGPLKNELVKNVCRPIDGTMNKNIE